MSNLEVNNDEEYACEHVRNCEICEMRILKLMEDWRAQVKFDFYKDCLETFKKIRKGEHLK